MYKLYAILIANYVKKNGVCNTFFKNMRAYNNLSSMKFFLLIMRTPIK